MTWRAWRRRGGSTGFRWWSYRRRTRRGPRRCGRRWGDEPDAGSGLPFRDTDGGSSGLLPFQDLREDAWSCAVELQRPRRVRDAEGEGIAIDAIDPVQCESPGGVQSA